MTSLFWQKLWKKKNKKINKYFLKIIHSTLQDVISVVATVMEVTKIMKTDRPGIEDCKQRIPMQFKAQNVAKFF